MPSQPSLDDVIPDVDLTTYPVSAVPAAFDRGHLFSPTADLTMLALDDRFDYRPGDEFEPMPPPPRASDKQAGGFGFGWWFYTTAKVTAADFLGLTAGAELSIQSATGVIPGAVVLETFRFAALVRFRNGAIDDAEMYVRRRNHHGHWY